MDSGIDYDLEACLGSNGQFFSLENISKVLAVIEGENDGPDWHWVLLLKDNRYVYLRGGCDYTGWDCQSYATNEVLSEDMPLHQAVKLLSQYDNDSDILNNIIELQRQFKEGKAQTWREQKDKEFGLTC